MLVVGVERVQACSPDSHQANLSGSSLRGGGLKRSLGMRENLTPACG
jgi:hypothetical protein